MVRAKEEQIMRKILNINFKNTFIVLGLIIAGFVLRVSKLVSLPVFADEAIYIRWSEIMRAEQTLRFLPLSDGKQPFYMWVLMPFLKVISDPLFAGRFVSVLCGVAIIVGVYLLAKLLFKTNKVAILAAAITTVSPFLIFFDRLALVDSMLSMFGVWTLLLVVKTVTTGRLDFAMLSGFALGGALLTKSPALFFVILLPTALILVKGQKNFYPYLRAIMLLVVTAVIGYGMYNILRLGPNFNLLSSRNLDYVHPFSHIFQSPLDPLIPHIKDMAGYLWMIGPVSIILLVVLGIIIGLKKHIRETLLISLWFIVPLFAVMEYAKVFTARYVLYVIPFLVILASLSIEYSKKWLKYFVIALAVALFVQSLVIDAKLIFNIESVKLPRSERSGYLEEWTAGQGIRETADFLISESVTNPNEKIVIGTEGYFGTLPDGLQMYLNRNPEIVAIGIGLTFDKLPTPLYESKKFGNRTYLLVNKSRFHNTPEKLGLKLVREFSKATKPDGSHDSLILFEVANEALNKESITKD